MVSKVNQLTANENHMSTECLTVYYPSLVNQLTNSQTSCRIISYFSQKYDECVAIVGLVKVCAILSAKLTCIGLPRLNIFNVAPTRQWKTQTSRESIEMFPKDYIIEVGSDFTIFSLIKLSEQNKLNKRAVCINDGTILFSSKSKRSKERLTGGISELASDGKYKYSERLSDKLAVGEVSFVMNMTRESYDKYEDRMLGNTFLERFIVIFHEAPLEVREKFNIERATRLEISFGKLKPKITSVKLSKEDRTRISAKAKEFSILGLRSYESFADGLRALLVSHAVLNGRKTLCEDDYNLATALRPYITLPGNKKVKIVQLYLQGKTYEEICVTLGMEYETYKPYISKVLKEERLRGLIK